MVKFSSQTTECSVRSVGAAAVRSSYRFRLRGAPRSRIAANAPHSPARSPSGGKAAPTYGLTDSDVMRRGAVSVLVPSEHRRESNE
jgi:hypothetical protein